MLCGAVSNNMLAASRDTLHRSMSNDSIWQLDFSDLTEVLDTAGYVRRVQSDLKLCDRPDDSLNVKCLLKLAEQLKVKQSELEDTTEAIEIRTNSIEQKACTIVAQIEQVLNKVNDIGDNDANADQQIETLAKQVGELATLVLALLAQ